MNRLRIFLISSDLFNIYGSEQINPKKSTVISAVKVIPQENPNISFRLIEIEKSLLVNKRTPFYELLNNELNATEKIVGYRGSNRWCQSFEQYPILSSKSKDSNVKNQGTYIVVGGLGDVGYTIAGYIAQNFKSNVVIVGRSEIPSKNKRAKWLKENGTNNAISRKIARIKKLESGMANVYSMNGDSTSYDQMKRVVEKAKAKFGTVNGIFYSAGEVGAMGLNLVNNISEEQLCAHLPSKVEGLSVLQKIVKNNPMDFVMVLSSGSSILGGIGMIGYAAANQYVDSLVSKEKCERKSD